MKASNVIGIICHLSTITAFQPITPVPSSSSSLQRRPSTTTSLMAHHRYYHRHPHHHHHPINNNRRHYHPVVSPLSSSTVDAEVLTEAQELLNEQLFYDYSHNNNEQFINNDSDGWNQRRSNSKDFRTTKEFRTAGAGAGSDDSSSGAGGSTKRQSEVINFDPEQPIFKPLKSADENNNGDPFEIFEEEYDDFRKFQRKQNAQRNHQHHGELPHRFPHAIPQRPPHPGMMPPPPPPPPMGDFELDDFGNDFNDEAFFDMPPPHHHHHPHGHHPHIMMPPMDMPPMDMPPPPPHFFDHHHHHEHDPMMDGGSGGPMFMSSENHPPMDEEEENYVDRVDFADHGRPVNDRDNTGSVDTFFSDRPAATNNNNKSNNGPPQQQQRGGGGRRGGPSVYTSEEEELIASMGGMGPPLPPPPGRPSTQEFAEAGTQSAMRKYPPPPQSDHPMQQQPQPPPQYREEGYLGDSTLKEISMDYAIPITYLADVLATWGVPIPIDPNSRLGDMVTGEQAFAILEAIHTLEVAELHERYAEDDLMNLCDYYDLDLKVAFEFCMERGWALPFGVRTFLRVEQEVELLDVLDGGDDGGMF